VTAAILELLSDDRDVRNVLTAHPQLLDAYHRMTTFDAYACSATTVLPASLLALTCRGEGVLSLPSPLPARIVRLACLVCTRLRRLPDPLPSGLTSPAGSRDY